ncbi:MAG: HAMP domain-containing protein [Candidatus Devosia euplotis]|nr:HAMP domain-containing protein [Candidatus Devosia euplotis]
MDRAPIEAVVGQSLTMMAVVGGAALLVIGILTLLLSWVLTHPIPQLSATMSAIASGDFEATVPLVDNSNEIGTMAWAVEVFCTNSQRAAELGARLGAIWKLRQTTPVSSTRFPCRSWSPSSR